MPLEAVMIIVDSSESSRNGDYTPNRFDAQADAVNIIFDRITQSNPESSVGLMSMGGKGPEVLSTLTTERGKLLDGIHRTKKKISGHSHLATAIQVASLALKHRQNKSQRQRIITFVCSPITDDQKTLTALARKMKKSGLDVDFVLFGEVDDDTEEKKLQSFNAIVKGDKETSHLVTIPPSGNLLSDVLVASPIIMGQDASGFDTNGGTGDAAGAGSMFGGLDFDPSADPELALALRMSMDEENARQARQAEQTAKSNLKEIQEEDENQPLLDDNGGPSGSNSSAKKDQKDDQDDEDRMDID